jgi:V/A-type H+-transporting ATPase subunit I
MTRIAVVAPATVLRAALVRVARAGTVELDRTDTGPETLSGYAGEAVVHGSVAALLGWTPADVLPDLSVRLAEVGAAAVPLPMPQGVDPPSAIRPGPVREGLDPLVRTYATVPYVDVDPTVAAGIAYVVMFGAMFGDVGHGALLALAALAIRAGWLPALRRYWLFVLGAGVSAALFGLGYGECFGPTGLVPTWWIAPVEQPVPLLVGGIALGAVLLAGAYALGTVNRRREGGWGLALYAASGVAGSMLLLAAAIAAIAWLVALAWLGWLAAALAVAGLVLAYAGLRAGAGRGAAGTVQAAIELFDTVVRLGANVVSFARLAAFGLTHAVLGWIVWSATLSLWHNGFLAAIAAVAVFVLGNALAFGLEALVAGVQALRLTYYELFSRVFATQGRPFRPWLVPADVELEEEACTT